MRGLMRTDMLNPWSPRQPLCHLLPLILVFLVCASTCQAQGHGVRVIRPPDVTTDETQITVGEDLVLRCEGSGRLNWNFSSPSEDPQPPQVENEEIGGGRVASTLKRRGAEAQHTGYYNCSLEHDPTVSDSFYVYVADPEQPWVSGSRWLYPRVLQHGSTVIDCRTNNRNLDVQLTSTNTKEVNYIWLPRHGFLLSDLNIVDGGTYECLASGFDEDIITVFLNVERPTFLPVPSVEAVDKQPHALEGSSTVLRCELKTDADSYFNMKWRAPYGSSAEAEGRWNASMPVAYETTDSGRNVRIGISNLTISNLTESDAGNYTCVVLNSHSSRSASYELKVYNSSVYYINFAPEPPEAVNLEARSGINVTWAVYVEAYPEPTFAWFGPRADRTVGQIAKDKTDTTEYKSNVVKEGVRWKVMLEVLEVDLNKRGNYFLSVNTGKDHQMLNLTLTVEAPPSPWLHPLLTPHQADKPITAECQVTGMPLPNVTWTWHPCPFLLKDCNPDALELPLPNVTLKKEENLSDVKKKSTVTFLPDATGIVTCSANNTLDYNNDSKPLQLTDLPGTDPLMVWAGNRKSLTMVEQEDVDLWCGALKENYTDPDPTELEWCRWHSVDNCSAIKDPRATVTTMNTTWSFRLHLHLSNLSVLDRGFYACAVRYAEKKSDHRDVKKLLLDVKTPSKPVIRKTNLNNSEWRVRRDQELQLECDAVGLPSPNVSWYREGKLVEPNANSTKIRKQGSALVLNFLQESDEGEWKCVAKNTVGRAERSIRIALKDVKRPGLGVGLIALIIIVVFVIIAAIPVGYFLYRYHKMKKSLAMVGLSNFEEGSPDGLNPDLPADEQAELLPYDKKWEFPRDRLKLGKQLGAGAFGVVMKAQAQGIVDGEEYTTVAVKMVKRNADFTYLKALASELKIMVHLGRHLNVVNLLGACTGQLHRHELLVIVEFCRFGNLHNYLLRHREGFVDQIDPRTGLIDASIGADRLERGSVSSVSHSGRIKYASLSFSGSSDGNNSGGDAAPQRPVDYRDAAAIAAAAEADSSAACGADSAGIETICMSPTGGEEMGLTSSGSAQPEWRSNYGGDYRVGRVGPIGSRDLLCWAYQVARGMQYLSSRKVLHGDLAARNILLAENNVVKICDFGLAKSMYKSDNYKKKGDGPLPVKWMALESIRDRIFSTQSDVWSFGVVLWELFSLGATPYPGMAADERLYNKLMDGYRMEKPDFAPKDMYATMLRCWQARPILRPSFEELAETIGQFLDESVREHYLDLNNAYMHMNEQWQQAGTTDYLGMLGAPDYGNLVSARDDGYINSDIPSGSPGLAVPLSPAPSLPPDAGDGYLMMRGSTAAPREGANGTSQPASPLSDVFSPRPDPGTQVFTFAGPRAPAAGLAGVSPPASPPVVGPGSVHNPGYNALPSVQPTSHSPYSPPKQHPDQSQKTPPPSVVASSPETTPQQYPPPEHQLPQHPPSLASGPDNYVNMPQQKRPIANGPGILANPDKSTDAFSNPSYINASALPAA